ncbi:MAG: IS3 family transposase [Bosea sp.]|nr:IS3 family transposase [Bosea sp. (in: a-proteobacteria)]
MSRSGFHAWLNRSPSRRARDDEEIGTRVRASFLGSDRTYGARRVWRTVLAEGIDCGLHRIERLMRAQALRARPRRRSLPKDGGQRSAIAPNTLGREFSAERPNQRCLDACRSQDRQARHNLSRHPDAKNKAGSRGPPQRPYRPISNLFDNQALQFRGACSPGIGELVIIVELLQP